MSGHLDVVQIMSRKKTALAIKVNSDVEAAGSAARMHTAAGQDKSQAELGKQRTAVNDIHEKNNMPPAKILHVLYERVGPAVLEFPPSHLCKKLSKTSTLRPAVKLQAERRSHCKTHIYDNGVNAVFLQQRHQLLRLLFARGRVHQRDAKHVFHESRVDHGHHVTGGSIVAAH